MQQREVVTAESQIREFSTHLNLCWKSFIEKMGR